MSRMILWTAFTAWFYEPHFDDSMKRITHTHTHTLKMCFAAHLLTHILAGARFSWRRGLLNINLWYTRQISVFKWGNLECQRLPDPNKFWQVQIVLGRTRETRWVHFSGVRGWGWKRGDLTMHVLAGSLNPLLGPPCPLCPLSLPSPPSAIASVRRRPSFPTSGNETCKNSNESVRCWLLRGTKV